MVHRYSYTLTNYTCRDEYRIVTVASSIDADTGHLSDQAYRRLDRANKTTNSVWDRRSQTFQDRTVAPLDR